MFENTNARIYARNCDSARTDLHFAWIMSPIGTLGDDRFGKFGYEPRGIIYKSTALKQL